MQVQSYESPLISSGDARAEYATSLLQRAGDATRVGETVGKHARPAKPESKTLIHAPLLAERRDRWKCEIPPIRPGPIPHTRGNPVRRGPVEQVNGKRVLLEDLIDLHIQLLSARLVQRLRRLLDQLRRVLVAHQVYGQLAAADRIVVQEGPWVLEQRPTQKQQLARLTVHPILIKLTQFKLPRRHLHTHLAQHGSDCQRQI